MKTQPRQLYMGIDTTTSEATKIRFVADHNRILLLGNTYLAEHRGRTLITPVLAGRGFAKLDKTALQYLVWNTFEITPAEDYEALIKQALDLAIKLPPEITDERTLQSAYNAALAANPGSGNESSSAKPSQVAPKSPNDPPKKNSTCGLVWDMAEAMFKKNGGVFPERKEFLEACEAEGINQATGSTQFAKWKKSKATVQAA